MGFTRLSGKSHSFGHTPFRRFAILSNSASDLTAPAVTSTPSIVGIGYNGQTLTATAGVYTGAASVRGQWYSDNAQIVGETGLTLKVTSLTEGTALQYRETVSNSGGSVTASSNTVHNWIPTDASAPKSWYDAADLSSLTTSGGTVSKWNDKGGSGYHLLQNTASAQPATGVATINGLNTLKFNRDFFEANVSYQGLIVVFVVARYIRANTANWARYVSMRSQGQTKDHDNRDSFIPLTKFADSNRFGAGRASNVLHYEIADGDTFISTSGVTGTQLFTRFNGINPPATRAQSDGISSEELKVGKGFGVEYGNGDYAEIVVSGYKNYAETQRMEGYLAHKWGLTAKLPTDHPYKSSAPTV